MKDNETKPTDNGQDAAETQSQALPGQEDIPSCPGCGLSHHVERGPSGGLRCTQCMTVFLADESGKIVSAKDKWGDGINLDEGK